MFGGNENFVWVDKNYFILIGRSENKDMKQCSSFENEVRPGVLMIVLSFSYSF